MERQSIVGSVVALWRYPVKSMMGEELNAADVTERGLFGDRAYALSDKADGKVGTAKNPRKWPICSIVAPALSRNRWSEARYPRLASLCQMATSPRASCLRLTKSSRGFSDVT